MNLAPRIPDNATVLLDTNPIIYVLAGHPLSSRFEPIFADVEAGRISALVTPVTLAEVVSGPLRAGKEALAQRYPRRGQCQCFPAAQAVAGSARAVPVFCFRHALTRARGQCRGQCQYFVSRASGLRASRTVRRGPCGPCQCLVSGMR